MKDETEPTPMMATQMMGEVGISIDGVKKQALRLITLLQSETFGPNVADVVADGVAILGFIAQRNVVGILAMLRQAQINVSEVVDEIRRVFEI